MKSEAMKLYIRKIYTDMQICEQLQDEEYQIFLKPNFNSAYWSFHEGIHKIVIGEDIFDMMDKNISDQNKYLLLRAFLNHEFSHSIWSQKELQGILEVVERSGFLFEVFNLFEDARVEENMRQHIQKRFAWTHFSTLTLPRNPITIFFYILQSEHTRESFKHLKSQLSSEEYQVVERVFYYYKKVLACDSSQNILKVMCDWYLEYPNTDKYMEPFIQMKSEKVPYALFSDEGQYILYPELFETLIEGLEDILLVPEGDKHPILDPRSITPQSTLDGGECELLSALPQKYNINKVQESLLIKKISNLFQNSSKYSKTRLPSKRLSTKALSNGSAKIFKKKEQLKRYKPRITLIVDMSGSMEAIVDNMQLVLRAMNKLSKLEVIECHLLLSALNFGSQYQLIKLPQSSETIERIYPMYGGEGLDYTMRANMRQLQASDYVWVLSDGCITTDGIDKEYYHRFGVRTHAFYIGSTQFKETMQSYFDQVVCCENANELIEDIFTLI